jgi:C-terminal processing protease CtpA/Prc
MKTIIILKSRHFSCLATFLILISQCAFSQPKEKPANRTNLEVLSEMYGVIRFYDPSIGCDTMMHWEDWLLENIPKVESAKTEKELISTLSNAFKFINPLILVDKKGTQSRNSSINNNTCGLLVRRKNIGFGHRGENAIRMKFVYGSELIPADSLEVFTHNVGNLQVSFPLTNCLGDTALRNEAKNRAFNVNDKLNKYSIEDRSVRLAIIIEVCNVMRHFYPYAEQMKINYEAIQKQYLNKAAIIQNNIDFGILLDELSAEYKDGHAAFMPFVKFIDWPDYVPEVGVKNFDNKLYVSYTSDSLKSFIKIGDEIVKVNQQNAHQFFKQKQKRVSGATEGWIEFLSEKELLMGTKNTLVNLELMRDGKVYQIALPRTLKVDANQKNIAKRPDFIELKSGYYYVNLFAINDSVLSHITNNYLFNAKGIVFDTRGYPRAKITDLFSHMSSDTLFSITYLVPYKLSPSSPILYHQLDRWKIAPQTPKLTSNIVFIIDGRCISAAEGYLAIVEHYKLGKLVGQNTAGTNGNINSFQVFGLYQLWYTNMYIPTYNGQCFQGLGIKPQTQVTSSLADLINGKDPFIEAAIKELD